MNIGPITDTSPGCYGVCCDRHQRCARYYFINNAPAGLLYIGFCYDQSDYPLFMEVGDVPALRQDAREPAAHAALPQVPALRRAIDLARAEDAHCERGCDRAVQGSAGRLGGVGALGSGLEAPGEAAGNATGATTTTTEEQALMACHFCGYEFDQAGCGYHGCPNCFGEGLK